MDDNNLLLELANKVQNGTSTQEEELLLLKNLKHSTELLTKFIDEIKAFSVQQKN